LEVGARREGGLGQRRQKRRFGDGQRAGGFVEIALGRSFHPIGLIAQIDPVEIKLEDFLLGQMALKLGGDADFLQLAPGGALGAEESGFSPAAWSASSRPGPESRRADWPTWRGRSRARQSRHAW
jgi:hypothetical protein